MLAEARDLRKSITVCRAQVNVNEHCPPREASSSNGCYEPLIEQVNFGRSNVTFGENCSQQSTAGCTLESSVYL